MEGTLSELILLTMLRSFHTAQQELQAQWEAEMRSREVTSTTWSWTPGTFVFPEGLCCYCGGVMRSRAIWRTTAQQFIGSYKLVDDGDGAGHFDVDRSHPHVTGTSICMGGGDYHSHSVADALFMSFNPLSSYFGDNDHSPLGSGHDTNAQIKAWLADRFDHRCGEGTGPAFVEGADNRHVLAPEKGCHCHHCRKHRNEVRCPRETCAKWYDPKEGHGRFKCETCQEWSGMNIRYCTKHKHDRHTCKHCEVDYDLRNVNTGKVKEIPEIQQCDGCGAWVCIYCTGVHRKRCDGQVFEEEAVEVEHCDCCMDDDDCGGVCSDCGHCDCEC